MVPQGYCTACLYAATLTMWVSETELWSAGDGRTTKSASEYRGKDVDTQRAGPATRAAEKECLVSFIAASMIEQNVRCWQSLQTQSSYLTGFCRANQQYYVVKSIMDLLHRSATSSTLITTPAAAFLRRISTAPPPPLTSIPFSSRANNP